jgi:hypothetical protein
MRKFLLLGVALALVVGAAGTALAYTIYDPNLGHYRNVPLRSYGGLDTPRNGQFGEIEMSGCQLVLDEPSLDSERYTDSPRWPVNTRMYLQCDPVDLQFTGYEWTLQASRQVPNKPPAIVWDSHSGADTFDSGPRVPGQWGIKLADVMWPCKDVNPGPRGTAQTLMIVDGTVTLWDTEGRDYPAKVSSRAYISCPTT